jgi:hypothetical protein
MQMLGQHNHRVDREGKAILDVAKHLPQQVDRVDAQPVAVAFGQTLRK